MEEEADLLHHAGEWAQKLRTISGRLGSIPGRDVAARMVGRVAATVETAIEQRTSGTLSDDSEALLMELLARLDESTWNGKTSQTKNDVLRQASYGVFPHAAELLDRSMTDHLRHSAVVRSRTFRPEPGSIDLSGADERDDR